MSIQAVAWALEQDLPGKAKLVLVAIANHADHTNGYCWLKIETIAREASTPERSLYRYIGALIRNGYLHREKKKGADGKQRANDYWVLLDRAAALWDWGAVVGGDDDTEPQDDVSPDATVAVGSADTETPDLAPGPTAIGGSLSDAEPSKPKPKDSYYDASATPRAYRPPQPEPQGALHEQAGKPVFVFVGTRAWEAWLDEKKRTTGYRQSPISRQLIAGRMRDGWYFPSLFPPPTTGPPTQPSHDELSEFSKSMT